MSNLIPYVSTHFRVIETLPSRYSGDITLGKIYEIYTWLWEDRLMFVDDRGYSRSWRLSQLEGCLQDRSFECNLQKVLK